MRRSVMIALSMAAGLSISAIQNLAAAAAIDDGPSKMNTAMKGEVCSHVGALWLCHTVNDSGTGGVAGNQGARHAPTAG